MALTVNIPTVGQNPIVTSIGARYRSVAFVSLDSSYPTGGYTLTPGSFGLVSIEQANATANLGGFFYDYDTTTGKLVVYSAIGTEVVAATDLSAVDNLQLVVIGQ